MTSDTCKQGRDEAISSIHQTGSPDGARPKHYPVNHTAFHVSFYCGMRQAVAAGIVLAAALSVGPRHARAEDFTPDAGAPFCQEKDDLQEYFLAMVKNDTKWMKQMRGCGVLKGGVKIGIIEDLPSDSELGHVQKVRVFAGGTSLIVYMLHLDLSKQ